MGTHVSGLENFTNIYTSKFFKKNEDMDDKVKRKLLVELINGLEKNTT